MKKNEIVVGSMTAEQVLKIYEAREKRSHDVEYTAEGYPLFNTCDHTLIDLSDINIDKGEGSKKHTLSIKLSDNQFLSVCVMDFVDHICSDLLYHVDSNPVDKSETHEQRYLHFHRDSPKSTDVYNTGLSAFILEQRKERK